MLEYEYQEIRRDQIYDCYKCKHFINSIDGLTIISLFNGISGFGADALRVTETAIDENEMRQQMLFNAIPDKKSLITEYENKDITVAIIDGTYCGDSITVQIWFSKKRICFLNAGQLKKGAEQFPALAVELGQTISSHFSTIEITEKHRAGSRCVASCICRYATNEAEGTEIIFAASEISILAVQSFSIHCKGVDKCSPQYAQYTYHDYEDAATFTDDHDGLEKAEIICSLFCQGDPIQFIFTPDTLTFKIMWDDNITGSMNDILLEWNSAIYHIFNRAARLPEGTDAYFITVTAQTIDRVMFDEIRIPEHRPECKENYVPKETEAQRRKRAKVGDIFAKTDELGLLLYQRIYEFYEEPITFLARDAAHRTLYFVLALGTNPDCIDEEMWLLTECTEEVISEMEKQKIPILRVLGKKQLYKLVCKNEEYKALYSSIGTIPTAMLPGEEEMLNISER